MVKKFVILSIVLAALFVAEQGRWLEFGGVNPDIPLVFFLLIAFNIDSFLFIFGLAVVSLIFVLVFTSEWLLPFGLVLLSAVIFCRLRRIMTGNAFLDFLISILISTLAFSLINGASRFADLPFAVIFIEALYNLALGSILWFILGDRIKA